MNDNLMQNLIKNKIINSTFNVRMVSLLGAIHLNDNGNFDGLTDDNLKLFSSLPSYYIKKFFELDENGTIDKYIDNN
jgi:hypothetical protein